MGKCADALPAPAWLTPNRLELFSAHVDGTRPALTLKNRRAFVYSRPAACGYNPSPYSQVAAMKLATSLLYATSALALVLVCGSDLQPQDAPLKFDTGWRNPKVESVAHTPSGRITALSFTQAEFTYCFWSEDAWKIVWYSGFGGELLAWFHKSSDEISRGRYALVRWEVWPDMHERFPDEELVKSLRFGIMSEDVDWILIRTPLNAPGIPPEIMGKEFKSINHFFDWVAYGAQQKRRAFVPNGPHATILAADESPSERARRAATETVDIVQ